MTSTPKLLNFVPQNRRYGWPLKLISSLNPWCKVVRYHPSSFIISHHPPLAFMAYMHEPLASWFMCHDHSLQSRDTIQIHNSLEVLKKFTNRNTIMTDQRIFFFKSVEVQLNFLFNSFLIFYRVKNCPYFKNINR